MQLFERFRLCAHDLIGNAQLPTDESFGELEPIAINVSFGPIKGGVGTDYFEMSIPSLALISSSTTLIAWMISLS
jgi:hypothetical protein